MCSAEQPILVFHFCVTDGQTDGQTDDGEVIPKCHLCLQQVTQNRNKLGFLADKGGGLLFWGIRNKIKDVYKTSIPPTPLKL